MSIFIIALTADGGYLGTIQAGDGSLAHPYNLIWEWNCELGCPERAGIFV